MKEITVEPNAAHPQPNRVLWGRPYVAALSYARNECSADLKKYCAGVEAGEGRLLECLQKNDSQVSNRCKQAFKDVA